MPANSWCCTHTQEYILQENKLVNSVSKTNVVCNVNNKEIIENCI